MVPWLMFVAFLVGSLVLDRFLTLAPMTRQALRGAAIAIAILWLIWLLGIPARLGL